MTTPTTAQLTSGDVRMRFDRFRFALYDGTMAYLGDLDVNQDRPPRVRWDATARLQRTLQSVYIPAGTRADLDTVSWSLQPIMVMLIGDEYPLGVFRWADEDEFEFSWGIARDTSLVDRSTILDQQTMEAVGWGPGASPIVAAVFMANQVVPADWLQYSTSAAVLNAPMSWPPGASRIQIITDLLAQCGFLPPYFDRNGFLQMRPAPDPLVDPDPILWPLGAPVRLKTVARHNTLLDTPNIYVVYDSSAQGGGFRGVYEVPPSAPHRRTRRGFYVPLVKGVSGLPSQADANAQAYALSLSDGRSFRYSTYSGAANPVHDAWSVIEFRGERALETAWDLTCRNGGAMTHTLRQVYGSSGNIA